VQILVVDDESAIRFLLTSALRKWGHCVTTANDGNQAWDVLKTQQFDLVISDWSMPGMDGLELCRLIRENSKQVYLYVILCTANNKKSDFITGMEAGADDFITKPIDLAELRVRLRAAERVLDLQNELASQNRNLLDVNQQLNTAYNTIHRDLQAAAAMQLRLLPKKVPVHRTAHLEWLMVPSSFLAGDMLNYFMADERHLVFYHLDVAGHGIPAALLSVTLSRVLVSEPGSPIMATGDNSLCAVTSPAQVIAELNRRFQGQEDEYFTIVYGVLDTATRELKLCQAGHPTPIFLPADGPARKVGEGGFPVGLWPEMDYDEVSVTLNPGDRLILYSDGIIECQNPQGRQYEETKLNDLLKRNRHDSLNGIVESIRDDIARWHEDKDFADDISLLAIEGI
jgi:phosphoserine phosphatase RsbU/P